MDRAGSRGGWRAALVVVMLTVGAGCSPAAPAGVPGRSHLKLGLPADAAAFLPIYLAAEHTFQAEGLNVTIVSFAGSAAHAQALASDAVDVNVGALNNLTSMISAGLPAKGFYAGLNLADFAFYGRPDLKSWRDLAGRSIAVSAYGGLSDMLTRSALRKHGLEPERDVQILQAGAGANNLTALEAGRADAATLASPFTWQAEEMGFTRLGTQATEIAEAWPRTIFYAKERFLDEHPNTIRALLRAHISAIRLARRDREAAVQAIVRVLKWERRHAERAYDEVVPGMNERGTLPTEAMPVFWQISIAAGEVSEPWPESRFFDRQFVDTFDEWAPK